MSSIDSISNENQKEYAILCEKHRHAEEMKRLQIEEDKVNLIDENMYEIELKKLEIRKLELELQKLEFEYKMQAYTENAKQTNM